MEQQMEMKYSLAAFAYYIVVPCLTISLFAFVAAAVNLLQFTCALMSVIIHPTMAYIPSPLSFSTLNCLQEFV